MKKIFAIVLFGTLVLSAGSCFADTTSPTLLDKIEDSTQDFAMTVEEKTIDTAQKTGRFIKDKSKTAASATSKAVKKGAKKTGETVKTGAKKAGHATKKGAMKATNWSATKIRNGAEKVIIKTEEINEPAEQVIPEK